MSCVWSQKAKSTLARTSIKRRQGFERYAGDCCVQRRAGPREVWMESHVDDLFRTGEHNAVPDAAAIESVELTCYVGPVIGLADGLAKEGAFLKKQFRVNIRRVAVRSQSATSQELPASSCSREMPRSYDGWWKAS